MSTLFDAPFFRVEALPFGGSLYTAMIEVFERAEPADGTDPAAMVLLHEQELEDLRDAIENALDTIRNSGFVQVKFTGTSRLYTYRDPSGELQPGDWVVVPTYQGAGEDQIVQVAALGRGSFTGDVFAEVKSRLVEQPL